QPRSPARGALMAAKKYDVKSLALAEEGRRRIAWGDERMPVLRQVRAEFVRDKPLRGLRVSACLHVTTETANLMRTLRDGGADVALCASNPLSTQDGAAAALVRHEKIPVYAVCGEDRKRYYAHLRAALDRRPQVTLDDGADLVTLLHTEYAAQAAEVMASMEETTTGVIRLRAMERDAALKIPVIAVNDADTKYLFDNRYGTGQSTIDGIIRATGMLIAGHVFVVCGYGWCGRGVASRARGMGAEVVVTEVDPIRALERPPAVRARQRPPRQPGGRRGPPARRHGHELRDPGARHALGRRAEPGRRPGRQGPQRAARGGAARRDPQARVDGSPHRPA